jgi:hypothetical protein
MAKVWSIGVFETGHPTEGDSATPQVALEWDVPK